MQILVTGYSGFIGRAVGAALQADGNCTLRAAVRGGRGRSLPGAVEQVDDFDLLRPSSFARAVEGVDCVVHAAGRVHIMHDNGKGSLEIYRKANAQATQDLAAAAAKAGVRRFVFLSSIAVHGTLTEQGRAFSASDFPVPGDNYAMSKLEAETALLELCHRTGMEAVIIRPPLVYGPGVKANFAAMMRLLASGVPLPLGAIHHNRRTLVSLDNLVSLIRVCIHHPAAANEVFLGGDGEDVSTTALLRRLAAAMGVKARLVPVPAPMVEGTLRALGQGRIADRLCRSLRIDTSKARQLLGWCPAQGIDEGFRQAARGFGAGRSAAAD